VITRRTLLESAVRFGLAALVRPLGAAASEPPAETAKKTSLQPQDKTLREAALAAMRKATEFYHGRVALRGGYVYYYSPDLQQRLGEGVASQDQIWVQPPGTPTVGLAYLAAYRATGDGVFLEAARDAGEALRYGQLKSGGWQNCVDFNPRGERVNQYRNGKGGGANNSTLDDGITQAAIRFLARLDAALEQRDRDVHESVEIALAALLKAQYPCGAFPQVWSGPVPPQPVAKASFPEYDWRTEGRIKNYWDMYTLNDGLAGTVTQMLFDVHAIYQDERYLAAAARLGDFLLLAQLPDPQPAWAQQYSYPMHPIWARKFEPPAVTGSESQDVLETLMKLCAATGDKRYLEPIPRALAYLKRSRLADGRLARYYELKSNRPLYMTRRGDEYSLTYDDAQLPSHYGWKVASRLEAIETAYRALARTGKLPASEPTLAELRKEVRAIVAALDREGRWIRQYAGEPLSGQPKFKPGERYLHSGVFSQNLETLSRYVEATRAG
jgi:PelA/Pel-15E family pectate lyase